MNNINMTELAYTILLKKNKKMKFEKLWNEVKNKMKLTPEQADELIAEFYTTLTMDGRLVNLGDNEWDLRSHSKYDNIKTVIEDDDDDELIEDDDDLDFSIQDDYETGEKFNFADLEDTESSDEDY